MNQPLRILHLEDLESDAELVERELRKGTLSFDLMVVATRPEFMRALDSFDPDIILSDHSLPGFDSLNALKILKERGLKTPFILVTATVSEEFAVNIMREGASDYILKDRLQRLTSAVEQAMEKYRFKQERQGFIQKIVENEALMKEAEKLGRFGSWEIDLENKTTKCSEETYHILGYVPGEIEFSLEDLLNRIHPHDAPNVKNAIFKAVSTATDSVRLNFHVPQKNGTDKYVLSELFIKRDHAGKPARIIGFSQDITEHKKKEDELQELTARLRELASHLQDIREEERSLIAREIHDELGQQLTAIKMDIAWILKKLDPGERTLKLKAEDALVLLDETIKTVRRIATELRPSILDDLGLVEAMKWQSAELEKRSGIRMKFETDVPHVSLTQHIIVALFRIFQESLTNVIRHADATDATVRLELAKGQLLLSIRDNGKGFDTEAIGHKKTLGLLGMKERTLMIGGVYSIDSIPGKGTTVSISVPVQ